MSDLMHIRHVCLQSGARQFWIIDIEHRSIFVYERNSVTEYSETDAIPLNFLSEATGSLAVKALFP